MTRANHLIADEQDAGKQVAGEQDGRPSEDPNTSPSTEPSKRSDSGLDRSSTRTNPDSADTQTAGSKEAQRT